MATASAQAVAPRGISARAIAANSALKKSGISGMKNFTPVLLAAAVFVVGVLRRFSGRGFSRVHPQFPHHDLRSGPGLYQEAWPDSAGTGKESGNYSFDYADCGGTVPGFACTKDEAYCYVGWWCDYNYPAQVNSQVHDQGTESCPARRSADVARGDGKAFRARSIPSEISGSRRRTECGSSRTERSASHQE